MGQGRSMLLDPVRTLTVLRVGKQLSRNVTGPSGGGGYSGSAGAQAVRPQKIFFGRFVRAI